MAAATTKNDAPVADYRADEDAARRGGGGGAFAGLRDRRLRAALYFALWGAAGVVSTSIPILSANPDHVILYLLLFMVGVVLLLLTVAAADVPGLDRAADRLEGRLRAMFYDARHER
ncbi:hypothetical protein BS78_04G048700 [Paspalum vaginatum]|nr:hypothetical protein BS78_04G048700 [Paspalum vaginatum]